MADILEKAGQLEEAEQIIHNVPEPDVTFYRSMLGTGSIPTTRPGTL
jgi:hypothetical protein